MTITDLAKSAVRTYSPYVVGLIVTFAAGRGIKLDAQQTAALSFAIGSVIYGAARLLEHYVSPRFGWLLGYASSPTYAAAAKAPAKDAGLTLLEVIVVVTLGLVILLIVGIIH